MSYILNIDTASEKAHVSIGEDGRVLGYLTNTTQKEHAAFLQSAINDLLNSTNILIKQIDAVAVTAGPGSYTGLRVGMASAKGLCYALKKPLITLSTLEVLAASAIHSIRNVDHSHLLCPMMDARRMEVFTAIYDRNLSIISQPAALILEADSYEDVLANNNIVFFGSGAPKWKSICKHPNALFELVEILPESVSKLSNSCLTQNLFANLAYAEPLYLKDFQSVINR